MADGFVLGKAKVNSVTTPVKIAAVGDIFPGDHYFSLGHGVMSRTLADRPTPFASIRSLLTSADIAIGNLEGPLCSTTSELSSVGAVAFRGVPHFSAVLKDAGFTH